MAAAEWAAGKTEIVSVLQPTTVYALAAPSTPDTVKADLLERLENGEDITDREVKQLIARAKEGKKEAAEANARAEAEEKLAGAVTGKPEANVASINADHEVETRSEVDSLAVAIHAVEMLSTNDRAFFDRWYRDTCRILQGREAVIVARDNQETLKPAPERAPEQDAVEVGERIEDNIVPRDDQEKSSTTLELVPEPDVLEVEDDPIIAMWLDLKPNSQKGGRAWVLRGAPAVVPWEEHHIIADRLKPWREAYGIAPPERQETIRRWLEEQRL